MQRGQQGVTLEDKKRMVTQVEQLIKSGKNRMESLAEVGLSDVTYYKYRKEIGGTPSLRLVASPKRPREEFAVTGLQFNVVDASEARTWIGSNYNSRFSEMNSMLIEQLKGLRKAEALSFPVPEKADKNEIQCIITSAKRAVSLAKIPWKLRYAREKRLIVAFHESRFTNLTNGER